MTRPASHRHQKPERRCANCRHAMMPVWKPDILCWYGDNIEASPSDDRHNWYHITLDGRPIQTMPMYSDEYGQICDARVVDRNDICDHWEPRA